MLLLFLATCSPKPKIGPVGSTHIHADFKVYLEGVPIDFSQQKYQLRARHVHVEDSNGDIVHIHATGVTLGEFFRTLDMKLTEECFVPDEGKKYCNEEDKKLKIYVNGEQNFLYGDYLIGDLDRILVTYGSEVQEEFQKQLNSITDYAGKERR